MTGWLLPFGSSKNHSVFPHTLSNMSYLSILVSYPQYFYISIKTLLNFFWEFLPPCNFQPNEGRKVSWWTSTNKRIVWSADVCHLTKGSFGNSNEHCDEKRYVWSSKRTLWESLYLKQVPNYWQIDLTNKKMLVHINVSCKTIFFKVFLIMSQPIFCLFQLSIFLSAGHLVHTN